MWKRKEAQTHEGGEVMNYTSMRTEEYLYQQGEVGGIRDPKSIQSNNHYNNNNSPRFLLLVSNVCMVSRLPPSTPARVGPAWKKGGGGEEGVMVRWE